MAKHKLYVTHQLYGRGIYTQLLYLSIYLYTSYMGEGEPWPKVENLQPQEVNKSHCAVKRLPPPERLHCAGERAHTETHACFSLGPQETFGMEKHPPGCPLPCSLLRTVGCKPRDGRPGARGLTGSKVLSPGRSPPELLGS